MFLIRNFVSLKRILYFNTYLRDCVDIYIHWRIPANKFIAHNFARPQKEINGSAKNRTYTIRTRPTNVYVMMFAQFIPDLNPRCD